MSYEEEDPFVPIWEGPTIEAEYIRVRIEAEHIPVDLDEALLSGHSRVAVPRSYLDEVRAVLEGSQARWPEITHEGAGGFDWKPGYRLAFIAMALLALLVMAFLAF